MSSITVYGLNFKSAPLAVREKCAFDEATKAAFLQALVRDTVATQAFILVTCNRTEIYTNANQTQAILQLLQQYSGLNFDVLENSYYEYHGQMAVEHILRVASGMDSMVVGETEIFGQVKEAFAFADNRQTLGVSFKQLGQVVFSVAKSIRESTRLGMCPVSVASIACKKVCELLGDLKDKSVLIIGSGETSRLLLQYADRYGFSKKILAARNQAAANILVHNFSAELITLADIHHYLADIDVVMTATASQVPILGKGAIETAMQTRDTLFLVDMAVPRDIEPEVANVPGVTLVTVDDLKTEAENNIALREHALAKVETLITREAAKFIRQLHGEDLSPSLKALYSKASRLRETEIQKCQKMLSHGADIEEVLDYLARSISNKLLHEPSLLVRYADNVEHEELKQFIRELFK